MSESGSVSAEEPPRTRGAAAWHVIAILVFVVAAAITFRGVLLAGPASSAMISNVEVRLPIAESDVIFQAWLTARNAHTILTAPYRIFDTPHCAPSTRTLTLGIPMMTMGLLAVPVALLTENPALAYNFATSLLLILSAMAMYLLVREWTGVAAAGVVAGLLYGFNPIRISFDITHPSVWDSAWTVFAFFFAQRLFARGRWRDAIGLALACSLQIGASFYPLLAAALMAPAFAGWLLYRYGFRNVRAIQLGLALVAIATTTALLLGPYLDARVAGKIGGRSFFYYAHWSDQLPGGMLFLGWGAVLLGSIGILVPRRQLSQKLNGDPRWVLVIGALVTTAVAAGPFNNEILDLIWPDAPFQIPNLYLRLVPFIPGLDSIRGVLRLTVASHIVVGILAGVGTAWMIKKSGTREGIVCGAMIVLTLLSIVPEPYPGQTVAVEVDPDEISFFEELEVMDNRGPVLELPFLTGISRSMRAPSRILPAAYHHRRMSTCYGSFVESGHQELAELVEQLPERNAIEGLRQLGFTTLILDKRPVIYELEIKHKIRSGLQDRLQPLLENEILVAFDIQRR